MNRITLNLSPPKEIPQSNSTTSSSLLPVNVGGQNADPALQARILQQLQSQGLIDSPTLSNPDISNTQMTKGRPLDNFGDLIDAYQGINSFLSNTKDPEVALNLRALKSAMKDTISQNQDNIDPDALTAFNNANALWSYKSSFENAPGQNPGATSPFYSQYGLKNPSPTLSTINSYVDPNATTDALTSHILERASGQTPSSPNNSAYNSGRQQLVNSYLNNPKTLSELISTTNPMTNASKEALFGDQVPQVNQLENIYNTPSFISKVRQAIGAGLGTLVGHHVGLPEAGGALGWLIGNQTRNYPLTISPLRQGFSNTARSLQTPIQQSLLQSSLAGESNK